MSSVYNRDGGWAWSVALCVGLTRRNSSHAMRTVRERQREREREEFCFGKLDRCFLFVHTGAGHDDLWLRTAVLLCTVLHRYPATGSPWHRKKILMYVSFSRWSEVSYENQLINEARTVIEWLVKLFSSVNLRWWIMTISKQRSLLRMCNSVCHRAKVLDEIAHISVLQDYIVMLFIRQCRYLDLLKGSAYLVRSEYFGFFSRISWVYIFDF